MRSYNSPGRVITVMNSGPEAVEVRRDQPYRLGSLVGVTQRGAAVDELLNLCVEGVFEQMVDLADGVEAAEAGTPVLMHVATFALVVGLTDATDHVHFGVLAERMTRRRVVLVKLMPATAAAPATGGGDGPSGGPEVTVLDIDSGTSQVTFDVLHPVGLQVVERMRRGEIRFNRHVYSSGVELVSMASGGWLTVAKDGFYEIELALRLLDQSLDPTMIGFLTESLVMRGEYSNSDPDGLRYTPAITSSGGSYASVQEYLRACDAGGRQVVNTCNRADAIWFNGSTAPYVDRYVRWRWRAFLRAGVAVCIHGRVETANPYVVPQFTYGGRNNLPSNAGTPDVRFANADGPRLVITRIA